MERDESVIEEFRHPNNDVTVRVTRKDGAKGRTWLNYRVGRYYTKDNEECFTVDLVTGDLPMAVWQLVQAYLWAKANPQVFKNGTDK